MPMPLGALRKSQPAKMHICSQDSFSDIEYELQTTKGLMENFEVGNNIFEAASEAS